MLIVALAIGLVFATAPDAKAVTATEKQAFLELVKTLPTRGEFFTDQAVETAAPHTRILLALTEQDVAQDDLYPFLALSRQLVDRKEPREYGVKHFGTIAHPTIKLFWAAVLFDEKAASAELVKYLRAALASREQSKVLAEMLGPNFEDFRKRLRASPIGEQ